MLSKTSTVRRPRIALALIASLLATVTPLLVSIGGGGARAFAAPAFTGTTGTIEAENLNGYFTKVSDSSATGGRAVVLNGSSWLVTGMAGGDYTVRVPVRSGRARMEVGLHRAPLAECRV